jgi:nicotinamidase/pyrazinamidase
VFVCGLALDVCVFYTLMDALRTGFETCLIEDASRGVDQPKGNLEKARDEMKRAGVVFTRAADLG